MNIYIEDEIRNARLPTIDDLKKNGIYQPPLVNDYEKEQIMRNAAKLHGTNNNETLHSNPNTTNHSSSSSEGIQSIMIDPGNTHFKQWQQSRRRTLDELESKGVINKNFFNFNQQQNDHLKHKNGKIRIKNHDHHDTLQPIDTNIALSTKAQYGIQTIYNIYKSLTISYIYSWITDEFNITTNTNTNGTINISNISN